MKRLFARSFAVVSAAALLFFCSPLALAQHAGYDLLQTASGTSVDLSTVPGFSADAKAIQLQGVPICTCSGNTDTIMHRTRDVPAGGGQVPVNVFALFMKGGPVTFKGQPVDVYITINNSDGDLSQSELPQPDPLDESTGTLTVHSNGTFDSDIRVHADVIIVKAKADVKNPANHLAHQKAPDEIHLTTTDSTWSSIPPAGYPLPCFPAGGFYPVAREMSIHRVAPATTRTPPNTPPGAQCVTFNPATTKAELVTGRWKVVDGGRWLIDFGPREGSAKKIVAIIQHYHANQYCSVGPPAFPQHIMSPFSYMLVSGNPLVGDMAGEVCLRFNPATAKVTKDDNGWHIVPLLDFGASKSEADQSLAIIKKYGFTQRCADEAPSSDPFIYMRK
jgi:hypothetical protein